MTPHEFVFDVLKHPAGIDALSVITFNNDATDQECLRRLRIRAHRQETPWKERASIRIIQPTDLGLTDPHGVRTDAILAAAKEHGLRPCSDEVCLCLFEQCPELLSFPHCIVAMEPVMVPWHYNGPTMVDTAFCIGHENMNGVPRLGFFTLHPWGTDKWQEDSYWVFEIGQQ